MMDKAANCSAKRVAAAGRASAASIGETCRAVARKHPEMTATELRDHIRTEHNIPITMAYAEELTQ